MIDYATNTVITCNGIVKRRPGGCKTPPPLTPKGGNGYDARVLEKDPAWRRLVDDLSPGTSLDEISARVAAYAADNMTRRPRRALAALVLLNDLPRIAALYRPSKGAA
jgi:hypothetical protein